MNRKPCRKCLLDRLDDLKLYESVQELIDNMNEQEKAPLVEYERRLSLCRECDELISGTCRQCGCFVELRAAKRIMSCPLPDAKWPAYELKT